MVRLRLVGPLPCRLGIYSAPRYACYTIMCGVRVPLARSESYRPQQGRPGLSKEKLPPPVMTPSLLIPSARRHVRTRLTTILKIARAPKGMTGERS